MTLYPLKNAFLEVLIANEGAELRSIRTVSDQVEYLWQRDTSYWGKSSPVLFPFVGELVNHQYRYRDEIYDMPKHGFARDYSFQVIEKSVDKIVFLLEANEVTYSIYPFYFKLFIIYSLVGQKLTCTYRVENVGGNTMWYALGAHPAFNIVGAVDDSKIVFNADEKLERYFIEHGLLTRTYESVRLHSSELHLTDGLFDQDAWVCKNVQSDTLKFVNTKDDYGFEIGFSGFTHLSLWSVPEIPFLCIEPTTGYNDISGFFGKIQDKESLRALEPNQYDEMEWSFRRLN